MVNPINDKSISNEFVDDTKVKNIGTELPLEVLENILSNLNNLDTFQASRVNSQWNLAAIDNARHEEFVIIRNFITEISNGLDPDKYKEKIDYLNTLFNEKTFLDESVSLIKIKSSLHSYREKVYEVLKDVNPEDLDKLNNLNLKKPKFFENLFEQIKVDPQLEALKDTPADQLSFKHKEIADKLIKEDDLPALAYLITKISERPTYLILLELVKSKPIESIIDFYTMLPKNQAGQFMDPLWRYNISKDNVDELVTLANSGSDREFKLYGLIDVLYSSNLIDFKKMIELVGLLRDERKIDSLLLKAFFQENSQEVIENINSIEEINKNTADNIVSFFLKDGKNNINTELVKKYVLESNNSSLSTKLSDVLISQKKWDDALEVIISIDTGREDKFAELVTALISEKNFDKIEQIIRKVDKNLNLHKTLLSQLVENNHFSIADQCCDFIQKSQFNDDSLYSIAYKLINNNQFKLVAKSIGLISQPMLRESIILMTLNLITVEDKEALDLIRKSIDDNPLTFLKDGIENKLNSLTR